MKIGFFGTPHLSRRVLEDLYNQDDFEISFVVTGIDKAIGRSKELKPNEVKQLALEKGIKIYQPQKIKGNSEFFDELRKHEADYFVVVAYGKILPKEILDMPKKMCLNVHGSILPLYRGASPIQSALINGEKLTGVTIMKMSEGMDEGDMINMKEIKINKFDNSEKLFAKFEEVSGSFLAETLSLLEKGKINPVPQLHESATYCKKITKEDGLLDFSGRAEKLFYLWRGLTPWPGIYTHLDGKKLIITKCDYIDGDINSKEDIGKVVKIDRKIGIICGSGILILLEVKLEGKNTQDINSFVNGRKDFINLILK